MIGIHLILRCDRPGCSWMMVGPAFLVPVTEGSLAGMYGDLQGAAEKVGWLATDSRSDGHAALCPAHFAELTDKLKGGTRIEEGGLL
jgi:hypothetical protein